MRKITQITFSTIETLKWKPLPENEFGYMLAHYKSTCIYFQRVFLDPYKSGLIELACEFEHSWGYLFRISCGYLYERSCEYSCVNLKEPSCGFLYEHSCEYLYEHRCECLYEHSCEHLCGCL